MSAAPKPRPIMVRVSLSGDEWTALRKTALDRNMSTSDLIATTLRRTFNLNGDTK